MSVEPLKFPFDCGHILSDAQKSSTCTELSEVKSKRLLPQTRHPLSRVTTRCCCLIGKVRPVHNNRYISAALLSFLIHIKLSLLFAVIVVEKLKVQQDASVVDACAGCKNSCHTRTTANTNGAGTAKVCIPSPGTCPHSLPLAQKLIVMHLSGYSFRLLTHGAVRHAADLLTAVPYFAGDHTAQHLRKCALSGRPGCGASNVSDSMLAQDFDAKILDLPTQLL